LCIVNKMNRIAIDLDEVLVPFLKPLANYHMVDISAKTKHPYLFREVFECTEEESKRMVYEFYKSPEFLFVHPIEGSQRAMSHFRRDMDKMYVVTGRQGVAREQTELWIERYFPGIFDDVILTNSFTEHEISKVDICRALSIGCIIDDSMDTCMDCQRAGVLAANFVGAETYPWCDESDIAIHGWMDREFMP